MANESLTERVLDLLAEEKDGLEVGGIMDLLDGSEELPSQRTIRNLLNELAKEGKLAKRRGQASGPGAPPYLYFHPDNLPRQLQLFDVDGVRHYELKTRTELEAEELEAEEHFRREKAESVLERIAAGHIQEETFAQAVINAAARLEQENPVDLVIGMAKWVVEELNHLGLRAHEHKESGDIRAANRDLAELDFRLGWARRHLQRFWRLDPAAGDHPAILHLPAKANHFLQHGGRMREAASLDENAARKRLRERIIGDALLEDHVVPLGRHKSAAGTDASVADIFLEHTRGSFMPPNPVVVTTAAAALVYREQGTTREFNDFDIFPDELSHYQDHEAAEKGLLISPFLQQIMPESDLKHSRMAAMDLRQYREDMRIPIREARWRPIGPGPALPAMHQTSLVVRDGRIFPLVHRLKDYEDDGLYGRIVRRQIEAFANVVHLTLSGPQAEMVYAAAVKSPELSWLSPLVFWYLHATVKDEKGEPLIDADEVFRFPFGDSAVSHLLFLGLANRTQDLSKDRVFSTCRVIRRFTDIALGPERLLPAVIDGGTRLVNENEPEEWMAFFRERLDGDLRSTLDPDDYRPFSYLCANTGVSMFYAAPSAPYRPLVTGQTGGAGHFLLPRLEVAMDINRADQERRSVEGFLSWLADDGIMFDDAHIPAAFDTGDREHRLPIMIPDVTFYAHETVMFARDVIGEEVEDEVRALVAALRRQLR